MTEQFEHVNLNEIDPNAAPIELGVYTFQVVKAELKTGKTGPNTANPGSDYSMVKFQLSIVNDEKFTGRREFPSVFLSSGTLKVLRRIMDRTGIAQEDGQTLPEWLNNLVVQGAQFKAPIQDKVNKKTNETERGVNLWEVQVA